jgi:hypothetical protein
MQKFKIEYAEDVKQFFSNVEKVCTQDEVDELRDFIEQLKSNGEISGFILTQLPSIDNRSGIRQVTGEYFRLTHTFDAQSSSVKIWSCYILSTYEKDEWKNNFKILNNTDGDEPVYITQVDKPAKIISAVKFIDSGTKFPFEIADKLGHKGEKRSVERHGQYLGRIICELGLGRTVKHGRGSKYELTKAGFRIASAKSSAIEERVMIEAMLGYKPMQLVYGEIIEDQPFSLQFVKNLIDKQLCPHDHTDSTSKRRAQALRTWAIWLCHKTGTPIRYEGSDSKQLFIPYLYADQTI